MYNWHSISNRYSHINGSNIIALYNKYVKVAPKGFQITAGIENICRFSSSSLKRVKTFTKIGYNIFMKNRYISKYNNKLRRLTTSGTIYYDIQKGGAIDWIQC